MYPAIVPVCTVIVLSLSYFATDMTPKKTTAITDRVTAKKAKAYIYGVKEIRKLAAVKETNRYVAQYMASCPKDEHTSYIIITSCLSCTCTWCGHLLTIKMQNMYNSIM